MNHLLSTIINRPQRQRASTHRSQSINRRNHFINSMYLRNNIITTSIPTENEEPATPLEDISMEVMNIESRNAILQVQIPTNHIDNTIDENSNALTGYINNTNDLNDETTYYSSFSYNNSSIRYFHNRTLNENETNRILNYIVENIYENQLINVLNDTQPEINHINNTEEILNIKENTEYSLYETIKHISKNDTCPITMEAFNDDDTVCLLKNCNHCIERNQFEIYISTFNTCPLCKCTLINI